MFCNIINVTVSIDQFNASLLNKSINFFQKKLTDHFWTVMYILKKIFHIHFFFMWNNFLFLTVGSLKRVNFRPCLRVFLTDWITRWKASWTVLYRDTPSLLAMRSSLTCTAINEFIIRAVWRYLNEKMHFMSILDLTAVCSVLLANPKESSLI